MRLCTFRKCGPEKPNAAKPLRFFARVASFDSVKPIINLEETIGKTVGRRLTPSPLLVSSSETKSNQQWRDAGFAQRIPRGVYRFHTHEEADEWLMAHLTRKQAS